VPCVSNRLERAGQIQRGDSVETQKAHSLRKLVGLPKKTREKLILALAIHCGETNDLKALHENGWTLIDPRTVSASPAQFQRFVRTSKGEFAFAKSGYVLGDCGWLSDRSLCYLASGRPVIAQETGFSRFVQPGDGLLSFHDEDSAAAAIERMNSGYESHRRAARAVAERYFDSDKVLGELLAKVT